MVDTSVHAVGHGHGGAKRTDDGRWAAPHKRPPPKFSVIMNEYVGGCMEDHCTIGKNFSKSISTETKIIWLRKTVISFMDPLKVKKTYGPLHYEK